METTLHRELKRLYAPGAEANEITVDGYRIDAVDGGRLIEVQCASLAAIRDKVRALCRRHDVLVVKPVVARCRLVRYERRGGRVLSRRYSPRRRSPPWVFEDLVHFTRVFPHERLEVEMIEIEIDEHRVPRTNRRRGRRPDHRVTDRTLVEVLSRRRFATPADFAALLPTLPEPFTTANLAEASGLPRWLAQKAAYFLRETGAWTAVGKRGRSRLHATTTRDRAAA